MWITNNKVWYSEEEYKVLEQKLEQIEEIAKNLRTFTACDEKRLQKILNILRGE